MKNFITANGFQGYTFDEYVEIYKNIFITAFNNQNLDFNSNTPFGNLVNILAQFSFDTQANLQDCYNLILSSQTATGINLDYFGSLFNVFRNQGSYTLQEVNITATETVFLQGLDGNDNNSAFLVGDGNGNNFALVNSSIINEGTTTLLFQAQVMGNISPATNTITTLITILQGITSCNNSQPALSVGSLEETDGAYRIRIEQSKAINSKGFVDSLTAALINTNGVSTALVLHNPDDNSDENGVPPHAVWIIVEGGTNIDIANAVFRNGGFGCGMKGDISVNVLQDDGRFFVVKFDRVITLSLYIKFNLTNNGTTPINISAIKTELEKKIIFTLNEPADSGLLTSTVVSVLALFGYRTSVFNLLVSSDNINFINYLETPAVINKWGVSTNNINIILT